MKRPTIDVKISHTIEELISRWESEQEFRLLMGGLVLPEVSVGHLSARLLGTDLVSVQPMAAPQGVLHYIDYVYGPISEPVEQVRDPNISDWQ